jgi:hypothetical protein
MIFYKRDQVSEKCKHISMKLNQLWFWLRPDLNIRTTILTASIPPKEKLLSTMPMKQFILIFCQNLIGDFYKWDHVSLKWEQISLKFNELWFWLGPDLSLRTTILTVSILPKEHSLLPTHWEKVYLDFLSKRLWSFLSTASSYLYDI